MRKLVFLILIVGVFSSPIILAQSIQEVMNNENLNYFEKIQQIEDQSSTLKAGVEDDVLKRYTRWRSFWDTRMSSDGNEAAYANAWHQIFTNSPIPDDGTGTAWEFVGPHEDIMSIPNYMGRLSSLAVDPNNQNVIYAGAETGGLWKCTNPTATYPHWECLTDQYAAMGVTDILVHPNNSNTIYIVTGIFTNGMLKMKGKYSLGAYKSTDGGLSWNLMTGTGFTPEENILEPLLFMLKSSIYRFNRI